MTTVRRPIKRSLMITLHNTLVLESSGIDKTGLLMRPIGAGTGGAGGAGAVAPPTKLLGEQVIHPAPPIFLAVRQFDVSFPEKLLKIVAIVLLEARFLS